VDFGPAFSGLTQLLAASNLDFVSFLPLDCVVSMNHHARMLGYTLGILVLDAVLLLAYKAAGKGKGGQVLMALFLVNSFLLPQVSMVIFSTFPCTEFDDDYGTYLTADKSIDCDGAAHAGMVAYATAMIFVFPVGKPLLCLYLLWRKRGEIDVGQDRLEKEHAGLHGNGATGLQEAVEQRDKNEDIKHLAFLYESYQPKYWWIALTGGLRLLDGGSGLQFAVGLLICFFGLRTVAVKKPYLTHGTNRFAEIVGWQLVLTFVGAQVVSISDGDKTDSAVDA
ncbi:hypothetical protein TeGR_g6845, partial [Tetraparma gracilis]